MTETFLTFQKFNNIELAKATAEVLESNGIAYELENYQTFFDPSYANNKVDLDIALKIQPAEFKKARQVLEDTYAAGLESTEADYYLFEFSDSELIEIITKPDEWGPFDYQLAQKILRDRGKEINPEVAELLRERRLDELKKPEKKGGAWVPFGYFLAIFGSIIGLIVGWTFYYLRKTLPNGERVYAYDEPIRKHGKRILIISFVGVIIWTIIRLRNSGY